MNDGTMASGGTEGGITRRDLTRGAAVAVTLAMFKSSEAAPQMTRVPQLVIASGGGKLLEAYRKAYYAPYTAATGARIVDASNEIAKLKAMVEAGRVEWDVLQIDAAVAAIAAKENLLEPLDYNVIQRAELVPGMAKPHYLVSDVVAYVMAWNTKRVSSDAVPRTWKDFWDLGRVPGMRGLWKRAPQTLEAALMADGVEPRNVYPLDVDRAFRSLDRIKPHIHWWLTGAQSAQLLLDGELALSTTWNGRVHQPRLDGAPVNFTFAQSVFVSDAWTVPRGAKNKQAAMEFIALTVQAKNQAVFSSEIPYGPSNAKAFDLIEPKLLASLPNAPQNAKTAILQDFDWWATAGGIAVNNRFNEWILKS